MSRSTGLHHMSPDTHGALDYALACALAMAPALFPAGTPRAAAFVCFGLATGVWLLSALTRYPWGFFGVVPFRAHGAIELALGVCLIATPWLAGFASWPVARAALSLAGVALLLMTLMTDYQAQLDREAPHEPPVDRGAAPPRQG